MCTDKTIQGKAIDVNITLPPLPQALRRYTAENSEEGLLASAMKKNPQNIFYRKLTWILHHKICPNGARESSYRVQHFLQPLFFSLYLQSLIFILFARVLFSDRPFKK